MSSCHRRFVPRIASPTIPNARQPRVNIARTPAFPNALALAAACSLLFLFLVCATARAQSPPNAAGDFGDAPEGILAYSNVFGLPVTGRFPTLRGGTAGAVFHSAASPANNAYFGWTIDFEWDGAENACASPYEQDEPSTINDCDAGVVGPEPYTIVGGLETPMFNPLNPRPLGGTGEVAHWGQGPDDNLDVWITNTTAGLAYVTILVDWDQDGDWDSTPGAAPAGELQPASTSAVIYPYNAFVLRNFSIPAGYSGWLSALHPPVFVIGPNFGFVWARFTISTSRLNLTTWNGGGILSRGESADFLWRVQPVVPLEEGAELGDAPDGWPAYPTPYSVGKFPTCVTGVNGSVWHNPGPGMMFGSGYDYETDGNHDNCSFQPYDNDELYQDGDAGLMRPEPYSMAPGGSVILAGPGVLPKIIGPACGMASWGTDIDIWVSNTSGVRGYVNIIFDWDRSEDWGGQLFICNPNGITEWAVRNIEVGPGYSGPLSPLMAGQPLALGGEGYVWVRFTISEDMILNDWNGSGSFQYGESEDYLLNVGPPSTAAAPPIESGSLKLELQQNRPNPVSGSTVIPFQLETRGSTRLDVFDIAGRKVRTLIDGDLEAGAYSIDWDGKDDSGLALSSGIYLYRLNSGQRVESRRLVLMKSTR